MDGKRLPNEKLLEKLEIALIADTYNAYKEEQDL